MTPITTNVSAQSLFLWIATGFLVAFDTAAALTGNPRLTYLALLVTAAGISFAIIVGLYSVVTQARKRA